MQRHMDNILQTMRYEIRLNQNSIHKEKTQNESNPSVTNNPSYQVISSAGTGRPPINTPDTNNIDHIPDDSSTTVVLPHISTHDNIIYEAVL